MHVRRMLKAAEKRRTGFHVEIEGKRSSVVEDKKTKAVMSGINGGRSQRIRSSVKNILPSFGNGRLKILCHSAILGRAGKIFRVILET